MQYIELRRHSTRTPGSEHLSQAGVALARRVGEMIGRFSRVLTSPSPWTFETAIAMGFAVDERYFPVSLQPSEGRDLDRLMPAGTPFAARAEVMKNDPLGRRFAEALRQQWASLAIVTPDGERVLVVTHGGYIDNSAIACLPDAGHEAWGDNFGHCEGIRLGFECGVFTFDAILRVP